MKPGHLKDLWTYDKKRMERYADKLIDFMGPIPWYKNHFDAGEYNPKIAYIKEELGFQVRSITGDFNFDKFAKYYGQADTIFILEVLEHLQNPLFFMNEMKKCLREDGRIYLTTPCNIRPFWVDTHYFEIPRKHFEKWILEPLGLKIVRYKKVIFIHNYFPFGFRPIWKMLTGKQSIKQTIKLLFHMRYVFYEIKKVSL